MKFPIRMQSIQTSAIIEFSNPTEGTVISSGDSLLTKGTKVSGLKHITDTTVWEPVAEDSISVDTVDFLIEHTADVLEIDPSKLKEMFEKYKVTGEVDRTMLKSLLEEKNSSPKEIDWYDPEQPKYFTYLEYVEDGEQLCGGISYSTRIPGVEYFLTKEEAYNNIPEEVRSQFED